MLLLEYMARGLHIYKQQIGNQTISGIPLGAT
jgi:hypothetical protein